MMHVCLHDSFGVNYACDFDIHQMRREVARAHQETRQNNSPDNTEREKGSHSPLATRKCCDIYESGNGPRLVTTRDARVTTTNRRL